MKHYHFVKACFVKEYDSGGKHVAVFLKGQRYPGFDNILVHLSILRWFPLWCLLMEPQSVTSGVVVAWLC